MERMLFSMIGAKRLASTATEQLAVKSFDSMPGPKKFPIIGTLWKYFPIIGNYNLNYLHETGSKMYKEFGNLVKEDNPGDVIIVNVFDPEDIEKVYKSEGKYPARRSHNALAYYRLSRPKLYNSGGIIPTNGDEWWRLRKTFQKSLTKVQDVRLFLPTSNKIITEFLDTFVDKGNLISDFLPIISRLNLELIWAILFGERLEAFNSASLYSDSIVAKLIEATEIANSCIIKTDMTEEIWKKIKTPTYKKLEKSLYFIEKVVEDQLSKKTEVGNCLLDKYLEYQEVDLKDIRGMVSDLILGGIDTTSYTACFLLHHLSKNKIVQEQLKEEALKLLPNANSPVTSAVLNDAVYTRAILKESFRLNPISTGISRNLDKDTILSGYFVPKGTLIITHNLVACRLEKYFKNANAFYPERWIRGSKEFCNVSSYLVLPFSHGPRTCIARRLAEQNLLTLLLKVGRKYSLNWEGSHLGITTPLICKPDRKVGLSFKVW